MSTCLTLWEGNKGQYIESRQGYKAAVTPAADHRVPSHLVMASLMWLNNIPEWVSFEHSTHSYFQKVCVHVYAHVHVCVHVGNAHTHTHTHTHTHITLRS